MPDDIKARRAARRRGAIRSTVLVCLFQLVTALLLLWGRGLIPEQAGPDWLRLLLLLLAVIQLLVIPAALVTLRQRLQEIKGGELDAAGQY